MMNFENTVLIGVAEYRTLVEDSTKLKIAKEYAEKVGYSDYKAFEILKNMLGCGAPKLAMKIEQSKINLEIPPLVVKPQELTPVKQAAKSEDTEKEEWEQYAEDLQKTRHEDLRAKGAE